MFIARWSINVKFGHKDDYIAAMKRWDKTVGSKLGWKQRVLSASIGDESRMEMELAVESLADLEKAWAKLASMPGHAKFAKEVEPLVVSGTNRWEIFRVVQS